MAYKTTVATEPFDQKYYSSVLIELAQQTLVYERFAQLSSLPRKNSKNVNFRVFQWLDALTTPLTEGTTPDPQDYTVEVVDCTVDQFGGTAGITDMVDATKPDPHLTQLTKMMAYQMARSKDTYIRDQVVPNATNMYYADGAATLGGANPAATTATPTATHFDILARDMRNNDAPYWTEMIKPGSGQNSWPIAECYWGVCHPSIGRTIRNFTGFIPVEAYAKQQETQKGEIGAYPPFRFVETTNAYTAVDANGGGVLGYYTMLVAPDAYGVIPLDGMTGSTYFHDFGSGDDVLEQRATLGWKGCWAATILDDAKMAVVEHIAEP